MNSLNNLTYILIGIVTFVVILDFILRTRNKKKANINENLEPFKNEKIAKQRSKRKLIIIVIGIILAIIITGSLLWYFQENQQIKDRKINTEEKWDVIYTRDITTVGDTTYFKFDMSPITGKVFKDSEHPVGVYINGLPDGIHKEWHYGKLIKRCNYINGEIEGLYKEWHYSGFQLKQEVNYVNGKKEGLYREWYENGQLKEEGHYISGNRDGLNRKWHESGNIQRVGELKNDMWIGTVKVYNDNGILSSKLKCDGKFIYEQNILNGSKWVHKYVGDGKYIIIN